MFGEGPLYGINGSFCSLESINVSKENTKCCLSLHYNHDNSYFFVNEKEMLKLNANNGNSIFPTQFCPNGFGATDSREVSLKGNICDFSVDYNAIEKSEKLNTHKCLMIKNNIK